MTSESLNRMADSLEANAASIEAAKATDLHAELEAGALARWMRGIARSWRREAKRREEEDVD